MTREIADLLSNDTSIKNYGGTSGTSAEWPASGAFDKIIGFQSARSGWAAVEKAAVTKNLYLKTPKNIVLTNYTIETRIDCCVYETPTNWTLSGSTDGLTWAPLDTRKSIAWAQRGARSFNITVSNMLLSYLRFSVSGSSNATIGELRYFECY